MQGHPLRGLMGVSLGIWSHQPVSEKSTEAFKHTAGKMSVENGSWRKSERCCSGSCSGYLEESLRPHGVWKHRVDPAERPDAGR